MVMMVMMKVAFFIVYLRVWFSWVLLCDGVVYVVDDEEDAILLRSHEPMYASRLREGEVIA